MTQPFNSPQNGSDGVAEKIEFRGIKTHNLKDIDVDIRHGSVTVITGPSGCGKSSLAFDTIYAEAKRQFLDSLSIQARQVFRSLPRPDIQSSQGLLPVVGIDQNRPRTNSRSTVATVTDIHDYLGLLLARVGTIQCSRCGQEIDQTSTDQIESAILALSERTKVIVLAPLVEPNNLAESLEEIRKAGYVRVRCNGELKDLESLEIDQVDADAKLEAVVDRLIVKPGIEDRVSESVAHALRMGGGSMAISVLPPNSQEWRDQVFSTLYACPSCNQSYDEVETRTFSYFSPFGVCLECEGEGEIEQFSFNSTFPEPDQSFFDSAIFQSINNVVPEHWKSEWDELPHAAGLDPIRPLNRQDSQVVNRFWKGDAESQGLQTLLRKIHSTLTDRVLLERMQKFRVIDTCPTCSGSRLCLAANHVFVAKNNIGQITARTISESIPFFRSLPTHLDEEQSSIAEPLVSEIINRLQFLEDVGVGYLKLGRRADSLSGGEFQRVRLATGLGNRLTDVCYVLDEPSTGLHPADNLKVIQTINRIRDQGNTVIAVEHHADFIKMADSIIDLGPQAGAQGGQVIARGSLEQICNSSESITGKYLRNEHAADRKLEPVELPSDDRWIEIHHPKYNNLKGDTFRFPSNRLVCVTGVSGSGKSSMVAGVLYPALQSQVRRGDSDTSRIAHRFGNIVNHGLVSAVVLIDQSPIGRSARSNPATFTGLLDEIRKVFAATRTSKQLGYNASRFTFNNPSGSCETCKGQGQIKVELPFMEDMFVTCESCNGDRFNQSTLSVRFKGKNIAEVLELSVAAASDFFANFENIHQILSCLDQVGLGYLQLGQSSASLSGGEAQRLKIANSLAKPFREPALFVLDEPTSGLHPIDIARLLSLLRKLIGQGHTVLAVEHDLEFIQDCDYLIDFGPGAGEDGGRIVATGSPLEVANNSGSLTGTHLAQLFDNKFN